MTGLIAPASPVPGPAARLDGPLPTAASRPAPSARAETARAPQPVESAARGLDIRFEDRQGRPVGPPPAFQISLLAAMQEAAREPRPAASRSGFEGVTDAPQADQVDRRV
jgi:hypothetical protein